MTFHSLPQAIWSQENLTHETILPFGSSFSHQNHEAWSMIMNIFNIAISVALILVCIFIILGNSLVVTAIWHESQLHSVTNYLIASLAAADCLVGALVMPFCIISEVIYGTWTFGPTWCHIWHSFDVLASTASIMNLCAISLDRYLAITDPISYPRRMTTKRVGILIIFLWTCSALISFPAILWWQKVAKNGPIVEIAPTNPNESIKQKCLFTDDKYYLLFSSTISFYGPLCIMLYAYIKIYKAAVKQTRFLNFGTKQVIIGNRKRTKSTIQRYFVEPLFQTSDAKDRANCHKLLEDGNDPNSSKTEHLILRAHRGGGANSNNTMNNTNNSNINSIRISNCDTGSNRWCKSDSIKSKRSQVEQDSSLNQDAKSGCSDESSVNVIQKNKNDPNQARSNRLSVRNQSFARRDQVTNWRNERKDIMRVISQRFEPQSDLELIANSTISSVQNTADEANTESFKGSPSITKCYRSTSGCKERYESQNGMQMLATMNDKSSGVDVKVLVRKSSDSKEFDEIRMEKGIINNNRPDNKNGSSGMIPTGIKNPLDNCDEILDDTGSAPSSSSDTFGSSIISVLMKQPSNNIQTQEQKSVSYEEIDKQSKAKNNSSGKIMTDIVNNISDNNMISSYDNTQQQKRRKKMSKLAKERKAAKTLGIVVGVFILCWLPFFVINISVAIWGAEQIAHFETTMSIVTWLGWLNSAMNPVIYACWSRDFRKAFRRTLCTWIEFLCPYNGSFVARKLRLKNSQYSGQESISGRATASATFTAATMKSNLSSSIAIRSFVSSE